jgi:hypothetical protein
MFWRDFIWENLRGMAEFGRVLAANNNTPLSGMDPFAGCFPAQTVFGPEGFAAKKRKRHSAASRNQN